MESSFYLDSNWVYRSTALDDLPAIEHGFGTRRSLDWTTGRQLTTIRQVHSDIVVVASDNITSASEGDGLVSNRQAQLLAIRTADCLPILIADRKRQVVAAVHAGWRGTVAGIAGKAIARMASEYGSQVDDLVVAIGPGIGPCCFEVGPEVASCFQDILPERKDLNSRTRIDLVEANRRYLNRAGLKRRQLTSADLCTRCGMELFESYRRDGAASGRMVSAIGIQGH